MEREMMPNLAPKIPKKKLKENWFRVVSNPDDPDDKNLCIQILEGPFCHVIVKYKNFVTNNELNEDGSLDCDYQYDIIYVPSDIQDDITDEQGQIFERQLGESIIELISEAAENANRDNNSGESTNK
jgi:hypothetical protein